MSRRRDRWSTHGGGPDAALWGLSRGTNNYTITKVVTSAATDGCKLGPEALMNMTRPVTYDATTNIISVGDQKGTPAMASFGSGTVGANKATPHARQHRWRHHVQLAPEGHQPADRCSTTTSSRST
jgi:hypothetical protein